MGQVSDGGFVNHQLARMDSVVTRVSTRFSPAYGRKLKPGRQVADHAAQAGAGRSVTLGSATPGSSSVTAAPPSGRFRAAARPACAWAMALTIARPRPAPPSLRARPESGRLKRSKACGRNGAGKPGPPSQTSITRSDPAA